MNDFDPNNPQDSDSDDCGNLAWNEFDWEQYLRVQDDVIHRYLAFYEHLRKHPNHLDEVARRMGWETGYAGSNSEAGASTLSDNEEEDDDDDDEPYTLHKNYIFIATRAIYLSLRRAWENFAEQPRRVPQALAVNLQTSLHNGEMNSLLAIQSLDFGDYALAISLFKRALVDLNHTLSLLDDKAAAYSKTLADYRDNALPRLFDLREIWLRMMRDCRIEIQSPHDTDEDDDE